jgi:glycosyltransferase involved in cell wall biosynthesis
MGKIVLGSNIGAIPESVSEEFLFNPKDRAGLAKLIKKWYNCPFAERIKIGEQLRDKVAEKHNPSQYLESLLNIYRRG